jgi:hypothetical protein
VCRLRWPAQEAPGSSDCQSVQPTTPLGASFHDEGARTPGSCQHSEAFCPIFSPEFVLGPRSRGATRARPTTARFRKKPFGRLEPGEGWSRPFSGNSGFKPAPPAIFTARRSAGGRAQERSCFYFRQKILRGWCRPAAQVALSDRFLPGVRRDSAVGHRIRGAVLPPFAHQKGSSGPGFPWGFPHRRPAAPAQGLRRRQSGHSERSKGSVSGAKERGKEHPAGPPSCTPP